MTADTDTRPFRLVHVGLGDYSPDEPTAEAYSNLEEPGTNPWPLFTKAQMNGFLAITIREHFQPFWIEELGTYAVVVGYDNSLDGEFPIADHMDRILKREPVDAYDDGIGFGIDYAEKQIIEVDGERIETFNFDVIDYDFWMADEPAPTYK